MNYTKDKTNQNQNFQKIYLLRAGGKILRVHCKIKMEQKYRLLLSPDYDFKMGSYFCGRKVG